MAFERINVGTAANVTNADDIRDAFIKVNVLIDYLNGGSGPVEVHNSDITAEANITYYVDTSANTVTITLPAVSGLTPAFGTYVAIRDYAGTFSTNNVTIAVSDGEAIDRVVASKVLSTDEQYIKLRYIDTTVGWVTES